jgi:hypothetical protein
VVATWSHLLQLPDDRLKIFSFKDFRLVNFQETYASLIEGQPALLKEGVKIDILKTMKAQVITLRLSGTELSMILIIHSVVK